MCEVTGCCACHCIVLLARPSYEAWLLHIGGSVVVDHVVLYLVLFSVAGTLGIVSMCTLGAAWLRCSVGCICVCTLGSAVLLDCRCACVTSSIFWILLSYCSVLVASTPFIAWMQCDSARMILSVCVSEGLVMFLCLNWTVSNNLSLLVCLMWHTCVQ